MVIFNRLSLLFDHTIAAKIIRAVTHSLAVKPVVF